MFRVGDLIVLPYTKLRKDVFQLTQENSFINTQSALQIRDMQVRTFNNTTKEKDCQNLTFFIKRFIILNEVIRNEQI